jgi:exodeoxyribonuclease VII large subunit
LQVLVRGRIDVFEQQGAVQLYVETMQPAGLGNLAQRVEELKARLTAEGLFDSARKRPLPVRPGTIAVVTSPTGAVWRDVRNVLARRWPLATLVVVPCLVQGDGAVASITSALGRLAAYVADEVAVGRGATAPSVTILARGGGSPEDLAPFNDERVVRAVASHPLPLVTGVGHEVDVTLVDFAADVRAPTPSAAAELVVPDRVEALASIHATGRRGSAAAARRTADARKSLDAETRVLGRLEPRAQLAASRERVGLLLDRATSALSDRLAVDRRQLKVLEERPRRAVLASLAGARAGLAATTGSLAALGPEATLRRGYAIVRRASDGALVREPSVASRGTRLVISLETGALAATSDGPAVL